MEEIRRPMGMLKIDHIRAMLAMERIGAGAGPGSTAVPRRTRTPMPLCRFESKLMESPAAVRPAEARGCWRRWSACGDGVDHRLDHRLYRCHDEVVAAGAARAGYAPDAWFSPDAVDGLGVSLSVYDLCQYEALPHPVGGSGGQDRRHGLRHSGGLNAGLRSLGVIEGSSVLGLTGRSGRRSPRRNRPRRRRGHGGPLRRPEPTECSTGWRNCPVAGGQLLI